MVATSMSSIAPLAAGQGPQQVAGVQHADDVVGVLAIERDAGVLGLQRLGHQLADRQVGVDQGDRLAVDHDLRDVHVRQVQHPAQHPPVAAFDPAFGVVVLDRAADLLVGGQHVDLHGQLDAEQPQRAPHDPLDGVDDRPEQPDHQQGRGRQEAGHVVRLQDRQGLGQHLGEHQDQHGHRAGGRRHAPRAGDGGGQHLGGQGRGQDVDQVVAQQHRPDHRLLVGQQLVDPLGRPVALALQLVHAGPGGGGQRGLGGREQRREGQQDDDDRREAEDGGQDHG
jgi:hypothetical protein